MSIGIDNAIWLAAVLAEAAVIALLSFRHVWRTLPLFYAYCIWDLSSNLAVYLVTQYKPDISFHTVFVQSVLDSALVFCVLVEVAWSVLRPVRASLPRSAFVIVGLLILVAGAAIWPFTAPTSLAHATSREGLMYVQLQQTTSVLRVLFFLVLAGGSQLLSIGWRDRELQVATGLGIYSVASLAAAVIHVHQTTEAQYFRLSQIVSAVYFCSLMYWAVSFAQKQAERREFTPQMRSFLLAAAGAARSMRVGLGESRGDKPSKQDKD
jgi:hypothetical protein